MATAQNSVNLLLSHDRSGSHYLGSYIRALPENKMIDEVCNEDALDPATNLLSFFGFRHLRASEFAEFGLRKSPRIITQLLDDYFEFLSNHFAGQNVTIDVKYGHVHNFEIAWWPVFRRPFLFEYARRHKMRVIHLWRWNTLETVISGLVAEARRTWHNVGNPGTAKCDAITVDLRQIHEQIVALNEQKTAFERWTRGLNVLPVMYEELVHPQLGAPVRQAIAAFLGTGAPMQFFSPYQKVTPSMSDIVRNWSELQRFCRANGLAEYLLPIGSSS